MDGISDLRIVGLDETRPPKVRKEPYIDLYLKLSHKAPEAWCELFNQLGKKLEPPVKIDKGNGRIIDAYVRDMNLIQAHLDKIKARVSECNERYLEQLRQEESARALRAGAADYDEGEQARLNRIIAGLQF